MTALGKGSTTTYFGWDSLPTLGTSRLDLRALTAADRSALFAIYGDAAVMAFTSDPAFPDLTYVDQMLASVAHLFAERSSLEWGVSLRHEGRIIGSCGLHSFDLDTHAAEIGCILGRAYWGQGLMREALSIVIDFGFDRLGLQTIKADIDAPNLRSLALFQRLGFVREAEGSTLLLRRRADQDICKVSSPSPERLFAQERGLGGEASAHEEMDQATT